jgi:hypothetical protein
MNIILSEEFRNWLLNAIDSKLISVSALIYLPESEREIFSPQELLLVFESGKQMKLSCGSDGESLVGNNQELVPIDLGEYGKEIVKDVSYLACVENLIGHVLRDVKLIKSSGNSYLMGLQFSFENNLSVVVVNLGDDLFVFESLPEEIAREEEITYEQLNS